MENALVKNELSINNPRLSFFGKGKSSHFSFQQNGNLTVVYYKKKCIGCYCKHERKSLLKQDNEFLESTIQYPTYDLCGNHRKHCSNEAEAFNELLSGRARYERYWRNNSILRLFYNWVLFHIEKRLKISVFANKMLQDLYEPSTTSKANKK